MLINIGKYRCLFLMDSSSSLAPMACPNSLAIGSLIGPTSVNGFLAFRRICNKIDRQTLVLLIPVPCRRFSILSKSSLSTITT